MEKHLSKRLIYSYIGIALLLAIFADCFSLDRFLRYRAAILAGNIDCEWVAQLEDRNGQSHQSGSICANQR